MPLYQSDAQRVTLHEGHGTPCRLLGHTGALFVS